ncbi:MAG: histone H1 [Bacteroidetes bacterium]|nr:MAG: histone H1 [Bacteroidota bacterium]TAG86930.1 MAG: histone H1 [Bacteroidota bacterium]
MENPFEKLREHVLGLESDFDKFYDKNNQAAGTRVRKGMQDLKDLAQAIRKEVQEAKNAADVAKKK